MALNNLLKLSHLIAVISVLLTITNLCVAFPQLDHCKNHVLLENQEWIRGAEDCSVQTDPLIQVVQYDCNTWIFRQNKCVHYEAPFMYLFVGTTIALLVDTGAVADEKLMPVYDTVIELLRVENQTIPLVVAHSHSHSDHNAGDAQFENKTGIYVIGANIENVRIFFQLYEWPDEPATLNLGQRVITILPIPGHEVTSVAFYDAATKLLVTGDTFYPGRLYVFDWEPFKDSIKRLTDFAETHEISYIVGTHIEMSTTPGVDYPIDATYHPEEMKLPLTVQDLRLLNDALQQTTEIPERIVFDKFIVYVPDLAALYADFVKAQEELQRAEMNGTIEVNSNGTN